MHRRKRDKNSVDIHSVATQSSGMFKSRRTKEPQFYEAMQCSLCQIFCQPRVYTTLWFTRSRYQVHLHVSTQVDRSIRGLSVAGSQHVLTQTVRPLCMVCARQSVGDRARMHRKPSFTGQSAGCRSETCGFRRLYIVPAI